MTMIHNKKEETMTMNNIIRLKETDSTNKYINNLLDTKNVDELTTVTAEFQTAGRGQRGNTWSSKAGENLLFSTVLRPTFIKAKEQFIISQAVSVAIIEVLSIYADGFSIKWPNDIYWHDKKIAGILIENILTDDSIARCIIGVGMNVNQQSFNQDIPNPISLRLITNKQEDKWRLLDSVIERLRHYYNSVKEGNTEEIASKYFQYLFRKSGFYKYQDASGVFEAEISEIDNDGKLTLRDRQGNSKSYLFKEVEYIL